MLKKVLCILLMTLVSGAMLTVDIADAARRSRAVRLRPSTKTVTQQPARTTTAAPSSTTKAQTPATTASQPSSSASTASTAAPAATAAPSATTRPYAAPAAPSAPAQSSGMSSTLLGAGAGLVGGYMLGSALSGPDAAAAAPAGAEAAQPEAVPAPAAAPSPVTALLGYDTAGYCTQLAQGNAELLQQCTAAEAEAEAAFRSCVAMSSGMNGIGSYEMLLRCLRAPAAR